MGKAEYIEALRRLGIHADDTVYCHSDMKPFMLGKNEPHGIIDAWAKALEEALPTMKTATLIMPAFCWDFYEGKTYDPDTAKCNTGCLNEYMRGRPGYTRTKHPAFSHIVRGHRAEYFMRSGMDAFGQDSVFGLLDGCGGKILFVGVPFWKCCTYVHYIEQLWKVPYREPRYFTGWVSEHGRSAEVRCSHYAKPLDGSVVADFLPLENELRNDESLREVEVDGGKVAVIEVRDVFRVARKLLSQDIESLIERKPIK